jgi:hypothetical protein
VPAPQQPIGLFAEVDWKTSSASIAIDGANGTHIAFAHYEAKDGTAPSSAGYLYCAASCDQEANWQSVMLGQEVDEVQLKFTSAGRPRLLLRAQSKVYSGGWDYIYAACDQNCTSAGSWQMVTVASSYGTELFELGADTLPQRYFALDPQDRPRFLYLDRNWIIEPSHYGFFYVACDQDCMKAANWKETLILQVIHNPFQWETASFPALAFTKNCSPRVIADVIPLIDQPMGIYYLGCDQGCNQRSNWQRLFLFDRGSGTEVSWDLEMDSQDRPRVAYYKGQGGNAGEKLYYIFCNENCLQSTDGWMFNGPGLPIKNGKHPDRATMVTGSSRLVTATQSSTPSLPKCRPKNRPICGIRRNWLIALRLWRVNSSYPCPATKADTSIGMPWMWRVGHLRLILRPRLVR